MLILASYNPHLSAFEHCSFVPKKLKLFKGQPAWLRFRSFDSNRLMSDWWTHPRFEKKQDRIHKPECKNRSYCYMKTATQLLSATLAILLWATLATLLSATLLWATLATLNCSNYSGYSSYILATLATLLSATVAPLATLASLSYSNYSSYLNVSYTLATLRYSSRSTYSQLLSATLAFLLS